MLEITADAREVLVQELSAYVARLPEGGARERYVRLLEEIGAGSLSESSDEGLARFLEVLLPTGQVSRRYGAHEEKALRTLYLATSRGRGVREQVQQANEALRALQGHRLESLRFEPHNPGAYRCIARTEQVEVVLAIEPGGVRIERVAVGG